MRGAAWSFSASHRSQVEKFMAYPVIKSVKNERGGLGSGATLPERRFQIIVNEAVPAAPAATLAHGQGMGRCHRCVGK